MAQNKRFNLFTAALGNDDASVNQLSAVADVSNVENICIHFAITGGPPTGTLYLDIAIGLDSGPDGLPVTWEEFDSVAFAAAGTQMWLDKEIPYTYARLRWEQTGGSGTMSAVLTTKSGS